MTGNNPSYLIVTLRYSRYAVTSKLLQPHVQCSTKLRTHKQVNNIYIIHLISIALY